MRYLKTLNDLSKTNPETTNTGLKTGHYKSSKRKTAPDQFGRYN